MRIGLVAVFVARETMDTIEVPHRNHPLKHQGSDRSYVSLTNQRLKRPNYNNEGDRRTRRLVLIKLSFYEHYLRNRQLT